MASNINLENLPQLVMEKITSFLNHQQLLALEQVSMKLKCAVDAHFSVTNHLIIGTLPEVGEEDVGPTVKYIKCLDGFLKTIKRCGIRLQTIQVTVKDHFCCHRASLCNYNKYFKYILTSAEVSDNCPNVTNFIASSNMDIIRPSDDHMFRHQQLLLDEGNTNIYANNIKISRGETCKLRSISLASEPEQGLENFFERILNLYSNLEQISVYDSDIFFKCLPQLIENGLKDLNILDTLEFRMAKKYCKIGKYLRMLCFALDIENNDDIAALNELQPPKNVEITIEIHHVQDFFAQLSGNVCDSIIDCLVYGSTDYSLMPKLKKLQEFDIQDSEQLKAIAEGSFPELSTIRNRNSLCSCSSSDLFYNACYLQKFLPRLFINKGNQLTSIVISHVCPISIDVVLKALKHCKAAKSVRIKHLDVISPLNIIYKDVKAICHLPNLQHFMFSIIKGEGDVHACGLLRSLMEIAAIDHTGFEFEYKYELGWPEQKYSLYRIHL